MSTESRPFLTVEGLAKRYPGATEPVFDLDAGTDQIKHLCQRRLGRLAQIEL